MASVFMKKYLISVIALIFLVGCETTNPTSQLKYSMDAGSYVSLGQSKTEVLNVLLPAQNQITSELPRRSPDQYMKDGKTVFIHYQRTGWVSDGRTTDDEFTPYVFENDKLIAIGWSHLGGPKMVSGGSSGMGGTVTINDPVRDSQNAIQRGQSMMSGACTLGINC